MRRGRSSSPGGPPSSRRTTNCSPTSPTCARSSSSAAAPAPPPSCRCASPSRRSSSTAPTASSSHAEEIAEELRVKRVVFEPIEATEINVRPNLKTLGPRLGGDVNKVRQALAAGDFEMQADGSCVVAGYTIAAEDLLVERTQKEGWAVASSEDNTVTVAFDTTLTDDLRREARVYDADPRRQRLAQGSRVRDQRSHRPRRCRQADADLLAFAEWIKAETLAVSLDAAGDAHRARAGLARRARRSPWRCAARGSRRSWRRRSTGRGDAGCCSSARRTPPAPAGDAASAAAKSAGGSITRGRSSTTTSTSSSSPPTSPALPRCSLLSEMRYRPPIDAIELRYEYPLSVTCTGGRLPRRGP